MVSKDHEAILRVIQDVSQIVPQIAIEEFGVFTDAYARVRTDSEALTERFPVELNCDGVQICEDEEGNPVHAFIIEVQRSPDQRKRFTWPAYVVNLFARLERPVTLIVICTNRATAKWASNLVSEVGQPGCVFTPLVLGPDQLPLLTVDDDRPHFLERSLLAMIVNSEEDQMAQAVLTYMREASKLSDDEVQRYTIYALSYLDEGPRSIVEILMEDRKIFPYGSPLLERTQRESEARGEARGKAQDVLKLLASRGVGLTDELRERVESCTDIDQLDAWFDRALAASTAGDVFDDR